MPLISSYCTVDQESLDQLMNAPKDTELYELKRLAQEVNVGFGLEVVDLKYANAFRPAVNFVTKSGINCGGASVYRDGAKDGKKVFRYHLSMPTINKDKCSANSDRGTRDSTNLSSLIRAIKKNKEEPDDKKLLKAFSGGMLYVMLNIERAGGNAPSMQLDTSVSVAIARYMLGVDSSIPNMYIDTLREKFDTYQSQMQAHQEANKDLTRYARGITLVGIMDFDTPSQYYLVIDTTYNIDKREFEFQGDLKRYNRLTDSPLAPTATMIKTYMTGSANHSDRNDLGVVMGDTFYRNIDISTGYSTRDHLWVAIPKHAQ